MHLKKLSAFNRAVRRSNYWTDLKRQKSSIQQHDFYSFKFAKLIFIYSFISFNIFHLFVHSFMSTKVKDIIQCVGLPVNSIFLTELLLFVTV